MPRRVLIADDNETIQKLVRSHVEEVPGVEVCAIVADGIEAVEAAVALRPDVLILDVLMPKLNGIEVAGVLKSSLPGAKVILFTLFADAMSSQLSTALGATVVSKVEGIRSLSETLKEVLKSRSREVEEGLARAVRDRMIDTKYLDLLTQQFGAPLTRCSRDLKYLWINESYANFLKRPVEKIVGRSILDVVGKGAFDLLQGYFDQALRGQDVSYEAEVEYQFAGRRCVAASYKPTLDSSGSPDGWIAYVEDITANAYANDHEVSVATPN